jgi:hypothetical protein
MTKAEEPLGIAPGGRAVMRLGRLVTGDEYASPTSIDAYDARHEARGRLARPLGDDAIIACAHDVLSTHPPLLGPYSTSSMVIGHPVLSPGPLLFWLFALPVRFGELAPAITMGIVNVCAVVASSRSRGDAAGSR